MKNRRCFIPQLVSLASVRVAMLLISALCTLSSTALGDIILVTDPNGTNGVRSYNMDGSLINSSLIPGTGFEGLALSGSTLYAANTGTPAVGAYTLNGAGEVISSNPFFAYGVLPGVTSPYGLTTTATNLFITNFNSGNVLKYDFGGTEVGSLSVGLTDPAAVAVSGDILWVAQATTGAGADTISGFSITTMSSTPILTITSDLDVPHGLAVSGNTLYVVNMGDGTIGTFDATTGASLGTLISGLTTPQGLTVYGSSLFVTSGDGTVKGFDASSGNPLAGFTTITGLSRPDGIVIAPVTPVPEPATYGAIMGVAMIGLTVLRRRRQIA